ncbi:unnamed protein product [Chrysodeixis includens]|uniref:Uncharacterized protein n=1 Tax=Chrysodeixis includens TaxID=689277 RepID=A0A9N8L0K7_CHRIL|nr:unnamed protein product [Chrysodeixis includens]
MEEKVDILDTSQLSFEGDFDAQVQEILQFVRLTADRVQELRLIFIDLEEALQQLVPGCQVVPFGSIVTGLGIQTSDVDCHVYLPPNIRPTMRHVTGTRNILKRYFRTFDQVVAITAAKVPIVKFIHLPTSCECDVNFHSPIGVNNSQLIALLLNWDKRALPLAVLIKYWSKVYRFTGTNLMANYSLILMLIFYLQTLKILPSVYDLQKHTPPDFVENWNAAFDGDVCNNSNTSGLSLYELMGGFFTYYGTFNYQQNVISPYLGRVISRKNLDDLSSLPEELSLYKEHVSYGICVKIRLDTKVCVQDPFQHNKNCTVAIYEKLVQRIIALFRWASKKYEEEPASNFLKSILTEDAYLVPMPPSPPTPQIPRNTAETVTTHQKVRVKQNKINKNNSKKIKRIAVEVLALVLVCVGQWQRCELQRAAGFAAQARALLAARARLLRDVRDVLRQAWPGVEVLPIGSLATRLAFKGSDVDLVAMVNDGNDASEERQVSRALALFRRDARFGRVFRRGARAGARRTRVLHLTHTATDTLCDLSFTSQTSVENNLLLSYYLKLDERIKPLISLIKIWIKQLENPNNFRSHILNLLVIFYMEQKNIVPPPIALQQEVRDNYANIWNTNFTLISFETKNTESLYQLLGGFFKYYSTLNFRDNVLAVRNGKVYSRNVFRNISTIPDEFTAYRNYLKRPDSSPLDLDTDLCIQDAFGQNNNVADTVPSDLAADLLSHLKTAAKAFDEVPNDRFLPAILTKITKTGRPD